MSDGLETKVGISDGLEIKADMPDTHTDAAYQIGILSKIPKTTKQTSYSRTVG